MGSSGGLMGNKDFIGSYNYSVDKRYRVKLPSNILQKIEDDSLILSKGEQRCVVVYTHDAWDKFYGERKKKALQDDKFRRYLRFKFASASEINIDNQGRIRIPRELIDYCKIDGQVTIVGFGDTLELWNPDKMEEEIKTVEKEKEQLLEYINKENL